jgi:hypothetical protein
MGTDQCTKTFASAVLQSTRGQEPFALWLNVMRARQSSDGDRNSAPARCRTEIGVTPNSVVYGVNDASPQAETS